jgi:hypothetical protein
LFKAARVGQGNRPGKLRRSEKRAHKESVPTKQHPHLVPSLNVYNYISVPVSTGDVAYMYL